jgi:hypothetical protein
MLAGIKVATRPIAAMPSATTARRQPPLAKWALPINYEITVKKRLS